MLKKRGIVAKGIFVGLATIDVVYSVDEFPASDSKVVARSQDLYVGGPATNASILFAHLGGKAVLVTAVGRHALTHTLHEEFKQYSIELSDIHPEFAEAPVVSSISIDKAGRRNVISANASRMAVPAVRADEAMLQGAGVLLVDGHFMPACQAWAKAARAHGMRTVLDGGSWKDGTEELLGSIDCAICSADFKPPGCSTPEQIIAYLKARGVANVAITQGAEPIQFVSPTSDGRIRIPPIEVVDTLGAGDFFHGAFCFYLSSGAGFLEALVEASRVASVSCRYPGTRAWLSHLE